MDGVPFVLMRGGTSKALFFLEEDLPSPGSARDEVIYDAFGSGDPRQIDGLGGADVLTSKLAIIGKSRTPGAEIEYLFGQIGIETREIDYSLNCGNISSAVGVFAIQEQLVPLVEPVTTVRVHNVNTDQILNIHVPVANGECRVHGDFAIAGVPGTGAEIMLDFSTTTGAMTGSLLPTGSPVDEVWVHGLEKHVRVSVVDVGNAAVFFLADDVGLTGTEGPDAFDERVLERFASIQRAAAQISGMSSSRSFPRPVAVAPPQPFRNYMTGELVAEVETDLLARRVMLPPPRLHKAFAATGAVCTGVAARIPGTVVNEVCRKPAAEAIRIGHPSGVFPVTVEVVDGSVRMACFSRTARRIMDGRVYVHGKCGDGSDRRDSGMGEHSPQSMGMRLEV
jgi:2-methylaconitate cis-trans-isomerase PrpF